MSVLARLLKDLVMTLPGRYLARSRRRRLLSQRPVCTEAQWEPEFVLQNSIRPEVLRRVMKYIETSLGVNPTRLRVSDTLEDLTLGEYGRLDIGDLLLPLDIAFKKEFGGLPKDMPPLTTVGDYVVLFQTHYAVIGRKCYGDKK